MPRDAYISPYAFGGLRGVSRGEEIMSRILLARPFDGKLIFYSSLFQAGIDRVVAIDEEIPYLGKHAIPKKRYYAVACPDAMTIRQSLQAYFNRYLPPDWFRKFENFPIMSLQSFVGDLLVSYQLGKPLLSTLPLPDL